MKIEIISPGLTTLFGDTGNIRYLMRCLDGAGAEFFASHPGEAGFMTGDLIYMGPMTEKGQERAAAEFLQHRSQVKTAVESGRVFLFTGNAFELMGKRIIDGERSIECLDLLEFEAVRDYAHRINGLYIGRFDDGSGAPHTDVTGFRSQFSHCEFTSENHPAPLFETLRGEGLCLGEEGEGVRYNNFMGTYLLGPILPLNPAFTERVMGMLGYDGAAAFRREAEEAYNKRLDEFWESKDPKH